MLIQSRTLPRDGGQRDASAEGKRAPQKARHERPLHLTAGSRDRRRKAGRRRSEEKQRGNSRGDRPRPRSAYDGATRGENRQSAREDDGVARARIEPRRDPHPRERCGDRRPSRYRSTGKRGRREGAEGEGDERAVPTERRPGRGRAQPQRPRATLAGPAPQIGNGDTAYQKRDGGEDGREARFRGSRGKPDGHAEALTDVQIRPGRGAAVEGNPVAEAGRAQVAEGGQSRGGREERLVRTEREERPALHEERCGDERERDRSPRHPGSQKGPERPRGAQRGPHDGAGERAIGAQASEGGERANLGRPGEQRQPQREARLLREEPRTDGRIRQGRESRLARPRGEMLGDPGHPAGPFATFDGSVGNRANSSRSPCEKASTALPFAKKRKSARSAPRSPATPPTCSRTCKRSIPTSTWNPAGPPPMRIPMVGSTVASSAAVRSASPSCTASSISSRDSRKWIRSRSSRVALSTARTDAKPCCGSCR